jgi:predicted MFS family arabinose efflux permease
VLLITLATAALLALPGATVTVLVSAVVYGATFMGVPAAVTAITRSSTPPADWTPTLAAFTALFAVGQTVGPWVAGVLADRAGSSAAVVFTVVLCAIGAWLTAGSRATYSSKA